MKRYISLIVIILFISSCKTDKKPRIIESINIKEIPFDASIRAIAAIDSTKVYFAASDGSYGFISEQETKKWKAKFNDTITPNFRSLAFNGDFYFAQSIGNPAQIYKLKERKRRLVYTENHEKVFYDSMKFFDKMNGIAMGDPTEDCLSIIITKDGGNTWKKIDCNKLPKTAEGEAAFAASNTNIKIINNTVWIATGGTKARVFKSTDMGESWQVFDTPIVQGNGPQGIYSMDFADENNGIIIGGDYTKPTKNIANKAITTDGGKTWTLIADGKNPNYKSCVQYVPNTNGKEIFAVGKTGVSYSNDGGLTWADISKESYYTIDFSDKNNAWLAGNKKVGKLSLPNE